MRYSKFTIENFKGVKKVQLDLDRIPRSPVFTLVGLNESGKTTILEAIHWSYAPQSYDAHSLIPKSSLANFNGVVKVDAELLLSEQDRKEIEPLLGRGSNKLILSEPLEKITVNRSYTYRNSTKISESFDFSITIVGKTKRMKENRIFGPEDTRWVEIRNYVEKSMIPPIIYYENFLFNFPERIYLEAKPDQKLSAADFIYRNLIQDVLNSLNNNYKIDTHIVARHRMGGSNLKSMEAVLLQLSSKMSAEIFSTWKELLKFKKTAGIEITLGQRLGEDEKGWFIEVNIKEGDQNFLIQERSLGFRWFFAFILFTHFRSYRYKEQRKALFLLDEPASNLHPSAQAKLVELFEKFPNQQDVIYSTHSHHMVNPKWLAGTFVVKNQGIDYSDVDISYHSHMTEISAVRYFEFVATYPEDTDYFRPILDALDYQVSKLELVPNMIVTEGKNDFYTLRYFVDMGFVSVGQEFNVYPGTGKDKVDYLLSLYLGWVKNFVVILDDDAGGRSTFKRLSEEYGPIINERVFRLNHISKEWKGFTLEDLFMESDKTKIIKHTYPGETKYSKSKLNSAIQQLYIEGKEVDLLATTVKRFQKLIDFLQEKMQQDLMGTSGMINAA